jgi:hypothetical protein
VACGWTPGGSGCGRRGVGRLATRGSRITHVIDTPDVDLQPQRQAIQADFGTLGITFRARKAATEEEWRQALEGLSCGTDGR